MVVYTDPWMKINMLQHAIFAIMKPVMLDTKVRDTVLCLVLLDGFCPFNVPLHLLRVILPPQLLEGMKVFSNFESLAG